MVIEEGKQKRIYVLQNRIDEKNTEHTHMVSLNSKGALQKTYPASWHYSVNFAPAYRDDQLISIYRDTLVVLNLKTADLKKVSLSSKSPSYNGYYYDYSRPVSARPQFFDFLKTGSEQLLLVDEDSVVHLLDGDSFKQLKKYALPAGTETTPLIADADGDGKLEMLVGCYDGYLYCFDLKTSAKGFIAGLK